MNWYAYVRNDPVNRIDPSGKITMSIGIDSEAVSAGGIGMEKGFYFNYDTDKGTFSYGRYTSTKIATGFDAGISGSLQFTTGSLESFSGKSMNGEVDMAFGTIEGGMTLDNTGKISSDSEYIFGVEAGTPSIVGVGGHASEVTTTIDSVNTIQVVEVRGRVDSTRMKQPDKQEKE